MAEVYMEGFYTVKELEEIIKNLNVQVENRKKWVKPDMESVDVYIKGDITPRRLAGGDDNDIVS